MQQVMNRIGTEVINWSYVESVDFLENDILQINFTSGRIKKITDPVAIVNLIDLFSVFPDINDDDDRRSMKIATVQSSGVKTQRTSATVENKSNLPKSIKTDIPERR